MRILAGFVLSIPRAGSVCSGARGVSKVGVRQRACSCSSVKSSSRHQFIRRSIDCEGWRKSGPFIFCVASPGALGPEVSGMVRLGAAARRWPPANPAKPHYLCFLDGEGNYVLLLLGLRLTMDQGLG